MLMYIQIFVLNTRVIQFAVKSVYIHIFTFYWSLAHANVPRFIVMSNKRCTVHTTHIVSLYVRAALLNSTSLIKAVRKIPPHLCQL